MFKSKNKKVPVEETITCPACDKENNKEAYICNACGEELRIAEVGAKEGATPPQESEVYKIARRVGFNTSLTEGELMEQLEDLREWCNQELKTLKFEIGELMEQIAPLEERKLRAKIILRQLEVTID